MLFEVPIPFLASTLTKFIQKAAPEHFSENKQSLSIKGVSFAWNYNINRPMIVIKGITYANANYEITLNKLGFYPNLNRLFKEKAFYIEKAYVDNLNFLITQKDDGKYDLSFTNKILLDDYSPQNLTKNVSESKDKHSEFITDILENPYYNDEQYYQLYRQLKKDTSFMQEFNEFNIGDSTIVLINKHKKILTLDISNLSVSDKNDKLILNFVSNLVFADEVDNLTKFALSLSLDRNNKVQINADLDNLVLLNIQNYFRDSIKQSWINNLYLQGFETKINLNALYTAKKGFSSLNMLMDVNSGKLSYADYISQPLQFKKASYKVFYDKEDNKIKISDFIIAFDKDNAMVSEKIGLRAPISNIQGDINIDLANRSIHSNYLSLFTGNTKINASIDHIPYNVKDNLNGSLKIWAHSKSKTNISLVKDLWPKKALPEVRKWIVNNIHASSIDTLGFSIAFDITKDNFVISDMKGQVDISDAKLTYLKGMPDVFAKFVLVEYNMKKVLISYSDAKTGNLISDSGLVSIYDADNNKQGYQGALKIDLKVKGAINDAISYIDNEPLKLATTNSLKSDTFAGDFNGNTSLIYLFDARLVKQININLDLLNASYFKVFRGHDATNLNAKMSITDKGLALEGLSDYLAQKVLLDIQIDWSDKKNIKSNYLINLKHFPVDNISKLNIIQSDMLSALDGKFDLSIHYYKDSDKQKVNFDGIFKDTEIYISQFDHKKNIGDFLRIKGEGILKNDNITTIRNISILGNTSVNGDIDIIFDNNSSLARIVFKKFFLKNKADFSGFIGFSKDITSIDLKGTLINITSILNYSKNDEFASNTDKVSASSAKKARGLFDKNRENKATKEKAIVTEEILPDEKELEKTINKDFAEGRAVSLENYRINLDFAKIISAKEIMNDTKLRLLWRDNMVESLNFSSELAKNGGSYAIFTTINRDSGVLAFKIMDVGKILRFFKLTGYIKDGILEGSVNLNKEYDTEGKTKHITTKGDLILSDFSAGVRFANAYIAFRGKGLYFRVDEMNLTGNLLGGDLKGFIDIKDSKLDLYGRLVPIWAANNLISNAPILKELFGNSKMKRNIIQINARIRGEFTDVKYSVFKKTAKEEDELNEKIYQDIGKDKENNSTTEIKEEVTEVEETDVLEQEQVSTPQVNIQEEVTEVEETDVLEQEQVSAPQVKIKEEEAGVEKTN